MKIKGFLKDVGGASRVTKRRQEVFDNASSNSQYNDPIGEVAKKRHAGIIDLKISEIREASKTAKTIRFVSHSHLPLFKAGQFLTIILNIGDSVVTRPYSISSAPYETRGENPYVEITVRKPKENGFVADYLYDNAQVGDEFKGEIGLGEFHYEALRDAKNVVAIAGGSGITPFVSMAKAIKHGDLDYHLTILFGSVSEDDIILKDELETCLCENVKVVHVLSGPSKTWNGEKGFINRDIIKKYSEGDVTYFVCGPQVMYNFVKTELIALEVPSRRIRFEVFGQAPDVSLIKGYPLEFKDKYFKIIVLQGKCETVINAKACESIATSLERAVLKIHVGCRSGACGFCRLKILEGTYFVSPNNDGRRSADKEFNYVHACATYPLSDLKIKINID